MAALHLITATVLARGGGHPACRRAGHLARRNGRPAPFERWSGRQDAALYGRQDARRYMVAVPGCAQLKDRQKLGLAKLILGWQSM
jgi:hypothetical protein